MLEFQLFGPFSLHNASGKDRRPRLQKACAILAVLAATPGHRRSRSWFRTMLWEDRQAPQAQASLRTALADIRRSLGAEADVLITTHTDIALQPERVRTDLEDAEKTGLDFLEGFDIAHSEGFEDWLREMRALHQPKCSDARSSALPKSHHDQPNHMANQIEPSGIAPILNAISGDLYLAPSMRGTATVTQMDCDTLVDGLSKSVADFGLGRTVDRRYLGQDARDHAELARQSGCGLMLFAETAEASHGAIARLKVLDTQTSQLVWSKSLTASGRLDIDSPDALAVVAEFVDLLADRMSRQVGWADTQVHPDLRAMAGVHRTFKLGMQNFDMADKLLASAYDDEPKAVHLAWRAFLRTFVLCEFEFAAPETVVDEGVAFARRALEQDPHNAMVLALCAHVENVMTLSPDRAAELAMRALDINRCNPMAWASLGLASAFQNKPEDGRKLTGVGARMASSSWYSAQADSWASAACILAGDIDGARRAAEASHRKSPGFAPPMRYLAALYCHDGQYDRAMAIAEKLEVQEPGFTFARLRDEGYPTDSLRRAKLLDGLPGRQV